MKTKTAKIKPVSKYAALQDEGARRWGCQPSDVFVKISGPGAAEMNARVAAGEVSAVFDELIARDKPAIYIKKGDKSECAHSPITAMSRPIEEFPVNKWRIALSNHYIDQPVLSTIDAIRAKPQKAEKKVDGAPPKVVSYFPGDTITTKDAPSNLRDLIVKGQALSSVDMAITRAMGNIGREKIKEAPKPPKGAGQDAWGEYYDRIREIKALYKKWTPELVQEHADRLFDNGHFGDPDKDYGGNKPLAMRPSPPARTLMLSNGQKANPIEGRPGFARIKVGQDFIEFSLKECRRKAIVAGIVPKDAVLSDEQVLSLFGDPTILDSERQGCLCVSLTFRKGYVPVFKRKVGGLFSYDKETPVLGIDQGVNKVAAANLVLPDGTVLARFAIGAKSGKVHMSPGVAHEDVVPHHWERKPKGWRRQQFDKTGTWPAAMSKDEMDAHGHRSFKELEDEIGGFHKKLTERALETLPEDTRKGYEPSPGLILEAISRAVGPAWCSIESKVTSQLSRMHSGGLLGFSEKPVRPSSIVSDALFEVDASRALERGMIVALGGSEARIEEFLKTEDGWSFTSDAALVRLARKKVSSRAEVQKAVWKLQGESQEYQLQSMNVRRLCQYSANKLVSRALDVLEAKGLPRKIVIAFESDLVGFVGGGLKKGKRPAVLGFESMCKTAFKRPGKWFMSAFNQCLVDMAEQKGFTVMEVPKENTSKKCPSCSNIASSEEDDHTLDGQFNCPECHKAFDGDIEVGAYNVAMVAITGKKIRRPEKEVEPTAKTKRKRTRKSVDLAGVPSNDVAEEETAA